MMSLFQSSKYLCWLENSFRVFSGWLEVLHLKKTPASVPWGTCSSAVSVWATSYLKHENFINISLFNSCSQWREVRHPWAGTSSGSVFAKWCRCAPGPQPWWDMGRQCLNHGSKTAWELLPPLPSQVLQIFHAHSWFLGLFPEGKTLPSQYIKISCVQATKTSRYHSFPSFQDHNPWHTTDFCPAAYCEHELNDWLLLKCTSMQNWVSEYNSMSSRTKFHIF